jgi:hypothetical protein
MAPIGDRNRTVIEAMILKTGMASVEKTQRGEMPSRTSSSTKTNQSKLSEQSTMPLTKKPNDRMPTNVAWLGDSNRTLLEGLVPKTEMAKVEKAQKAEEEKKRKEKERKQKRR